jgi:hypothetical protein
MLVCHPEPFAVILSEAKNLALPAQDKLREGSLQFVAACGIQKATAEILRFAQDDRRVDQ